MVSTGMNLYEAIMSRTSTRRYDRTPLDPEILQRVQEVIASVQPLVPGNRFGTLQRDAAGEDLVRRLGAYGHLVTPPHYLLPYMTGERHVQADLGYRAEQICVRLTQMGIGTCFIGALGREDKVRQQLGLPAEAQFVAFIIFGRPATALVGRTVNAAFHSLSGGSGRMPVERLFFLDSVESPGKPPEAIAPLVEAGRWAPSAVNAQPWRLLWRSGTLHLFVTSRNLKYTAGRLPYHLHDGGICMANVTLAMEALDIDGSWHMYEGEEDVPAHPDNLQPLGRLILER